MTDQMTDHAASAPGRRRKGWRVIVITATLAVLSTMLFTAAADSWGINIKGGPGSGAVLKCPGGMTTLAHPFDEGFTTVFPGDPEVMVEIINTIPVDFFLLEKVTTGTHGGTHLDAPRHFIEVGRSIDQIAAEEFVWPVYVIDVRDRVAAEGPDFLVEQADIEAYEDTYGKIRKGSLVVIQTGHEELFGTPDYTGVNHPGFSGDAVNWLFDKRKIDALGSDGLGPDASVDQDFSATFNALALDGLTLPGMNNLDSLQVRGDLVMAPAVPLVGGSGFQVQPLACHG